MLARSSPFHSVIGTMTLSGSMPMLSSFMMTDGRVFLISAPTVGSSETLHTSPRFMIVEWFAIQRGECSQLAVGFVQRQGSNCRFMTSSVLFLVRVGLRRSHRTGIKLFAYLMERGF